MPRRTDEKVKKSVMRKLQKYWGDIHIETDDIYECTFSSKNISAYVRSRYFSDEDVTALGSRFERLFFQPHFSLGVLAPSPADNVSQVRLSISLNADILKRLVDEMNDRHPLGDNPSPFKTDWFNDLWRELEINCLNGQYRSPFSQLRNNRRGIPSGYLYSDVLIISPKDEGAAVFWPALLLEQRSYFLKPRYLLDWLNRYRSMHGEDEWRRILPPDRDAS
jgi:hypothetical protein